MYAIGDASEGMLRADAARPAGMERPRGDAVIRDDDEGADGVVTPEDAARACAGRCVVNDYDAPSSSPEREMQTDSAASIRWAINPSRPEGPMPYVENATYRRLNNNEQETNRQQAPNGGKLVQIFRQ